MVVAIAVLIFAGCASIGADDDRAAESLTEIQALADATARAYGFAPVRVVLRASSGSWTAIRQMDVSPRLVNAPLPDRDAHAAMLLAFWVVKPPDVRSEAHEIQVNRQIYPERNAAAVEILTAVKGLPTSTAIDAVHAVLAAQAQAVADKQSAPIRNAPHPCEQLAAFVDRFPRHRFERVGACPAAR